MTKTMKRMVVIFTLALAMIMPLTAPITAQASTTKNIWEFRATVDTFTTYVGQVFWCSVSNSIKGNTITYKSSKPSVATVDQNGYVTGKKAGKTTITMSDGVHTVKTVVTVKKISGNGVILNYSDRMRFEYGKTYTIKNLNGSAVKSITGNSKKVKISGTKVTLTPETGTPTTLTFTLKNGKKFSRSYSCTSNKVREEALSIGRKAAAAAGINSKSSDLEKAMFIYNWLGENCRYALSKKSGHYYAILEGKGNCDAYAEGVSLLGDVVGMWTVRVVTTDNSHAYNGIRVDGKWYLMDTTMCEAWDFALAMGQFLYSKECVEKVSGMEFTVAAGALSDIVFDNTEYDDKAWSEYYDKYIEANPPAYDEDFE